MIVALVVAGIGQGPQLVALFAVRHREAPENLRGQIFTTGASLKITGFAAGAAIAGPVATWSLPGALTLAAVVNIKRLNTGREVTVTWIAQDRTLRSGHYTTWRGANLGDRPKVWAGPGGVGEDPPRIHARTISDATVGGAMTVLLAGLVPAGVYLLLRRRCDKRRYRMWDDAWAGFDRRRIGS